MFLKARWIVPVSSEPIKDGWVRIKDGLIAEIGTTPVEADKDLGNCALFPGFINAHCHLEFGAAAQPRLSFSRWAKSVQQGQQNDTEEQLAERWQRNLQRLLETGCTTIVNHCNRAPNGRVLSRLDLGLRPGDGPKASPRHPSRLTHVCEIVGSSEKRGTESYRDACKMRLDILESNGEAVVSPTSLYAVSPVVLEQFIEQRDENALLSIHLKESAEENELFEHKTGGLAALVKAKGGETWLNDPVAWLREKNLLGPQTLLIHGNYLTETDIAILQGQEASVIHCPGSHAYFGHQRFPLESLQSGGINVGLGTDSLASNETLSMLQEHRQLRTQYLELSPEAALKMATLNGAKAIGEEETRGSLEPGKWADMMAIPCQGDDPYDALLMAEQVRLTMVQGEIVFE